MREVLSDLVAEQQQLDQFLQRITVNKWSIRIPEHEWTIRDTISHLAHFQEYACNAVEEDGAMLDDLDDYESVDDLAEIGVERGRQMRPQDVIEWWRLGRAQVVDAMSRASASDRVPWVYSDMSAKTFATLQLAEVWAHGLDIYEAMDEEPEDTDRLRHVIWFAQKTLPWAFDLAGYEHMDPVRIEGIGPMYAKYVAGPEDTDQLIRGPAGEICRVAVGRLHPDDAENVILKGDDRRDSLPGDAHLLMASRQLIGMVHALPLPGSPSYRPPTGAIVERAVEDAVQLEECGFDALLVENYGDAPFFADRVPPVTVASLARVVSAVRAAVDIPVGVNVLRNDAIAALSIAAACDARFIRVNVLSSMMYTDQGPIVGQAARLSRLRAALDPGDRGAGRSVREARHSPARPPHRGCGSPISGTGQWRTASSSPGAAPASRRTMDMIHQVRQAVPDTRLLVGSGVDTESVASLLRTADGVIVGTSIKEEGDVRRPVDPARARALVQRPPVARRGQAS